MRPGHGRLKKHFVKQGFLQRFGIPNLKKSLKIFQNTLGPQSANVLRRDKWQSRSYLVTKACGLTSASIVRTWGDWYWLSAAFVIICCIKGKVTKRKVGLDGDNISRLGSERRHRPARRRYKWPGGRPNLSRGGKLKTGVLQTENEGRIFAQQGDGPSFDFLWLWWNRLWPPVFCLCIRWQQWARPNQPERSFFSCLSFCM